MPDAVFVHPARDANPMLMEALLAELFRKVLDIQMGVTLKTA
ncbi:MAG: hypothetical protein ABSF50_17305 [Burkholderiaceae bacterium]